MKILFLDTVHPYLAAELTRKEFICEFDYISSKEDLFPALHHYTGIVIRSRIKIDKVFIDHCTNLKFIARVGAGLENIDVAYAESKGIKCLHAPEGNRDAVGEHTVAMLLALFTNLIRADRQVREGKWIREGNRGIELMGKTVGIIGYGNMGCAFAQRLKGFGVSVLAYDKYKQNYSDAYVKESTMQQLFEETDVLSLHLPLTEETVFLVDDSFINKFKKNIYLINTARGKILKTADLVKNMEKGKVLGACLDVLEFEAGSFENIEFAPEAFQYLVNSNKVVLSPHIAGWTHESNLKMAMELTDKIKNVKLITQNS